MRAAISTAASGDTTLVAAVAGRRIRVLGYLIVAAGAVVAKFKDGSTDITGAMTLATGVPNSSPPANSLDVQPCLQTSPGAALVLNLGGAVQVSGWLVYDLSL